jgi:hypothetical protein
VPGDRRIRAMPCHVELHDHDTTSADYTMEIGLQQI